MRRVVAVLAAAGFTALLAGCGPSFDYTSSAPATTAEQVEETTPAPPPAPPAAPSLSTMEEVFISVIDAEGISYSTEQAMLDTGYGVCDYIDAGGTPIGGAQAIASSGAFTTYESGFIMGAAIASFCPEYMDMVTG